MANRPAFVGRIGVLIVALSAALLAQPAVRPAPPPDLDPWVARVMQAFDVPGIGLAIVKDDTVVTARGYGVRKLGELPWVRARPGHP
jgi:CubicO group peptidase (beta-lactamase class C family)